MAIERIGEYSVKVPDPPKDKTLIDGYDLPKKQQKWKKPDLPYDSVRDMDWYELREEEKSYNCRYIDRLGNYNNKGNGKLNEDFIAFDWVNPELETFRLREWDRRLNGYWFYNNGVPTFITGLHYFYLAYWPLDSGPADYVDADREFFLWWKFEIEDDPECYGGSEITRRRMGKSWRAAVIVYEYSSRTKNCHCGMQSKERQAAEDWFTEKVVGPWKSMPDFFQPETSSGSDPVKEMVFKEEKRKGAAARRIKGNRTELNSKISWGPSTPTHYDGQKLHRVIHDEVGKTIECDVSERWDIVKKCLQVSGVIIGKALLTTTVEEMEKKGGKNFKKIWDDSDPTKKIEGQTSSGLKRLFVPAWKGYKVDEYGNTMEAESKKAIANERKRQAHDAKKLAAEKRRNPMTVREAFSGDTSKCHFDAEKIERRLEYLESLDKPLYVKGNFGWEGNKQDGRVVFKQNYNGRFLVTFHPDPELRNNVQRDSTGKPVKPLNRAKWVIGCDPFDHEVTTSHKFSDAGAYVFRKFDMAIDGGQPVQKWATHRFVVEYLARPKPKQFYEDMLCLAVYYGCQILAETQKIGLINYFKSRGYGQFLMMRPEHMHTSNTRSQKSPGLPSSELVINNYVDEWDSYISENMFGHVDEENPDGHVDLIDFPRLLNQLKDFDINDTQDFDAVVGSGYALIGAQKRTPQNRRKLNIGEFFQVYDNTGNVSRALYDPFADTDDDGIVDPDDDSDTGEMNEYREFVKTRE